MEKTEAPPITDEELHTIALEVEGWDIWGMSMVTAAHASWVGCRLVAEVRRLRSDEWLQRAAEEHAGQGTEADYSGRSHAVSHLVAILRKHRDGKAAQPTRRFHSEECSEERRRDPRVCICGAGDGPDIKRGTRDGKA